MTTNDKPVCDVTAHLIDLLRTRDEAGRAKYGATLDRTDLTPEQWIQHAVEELLDGAGYLLALKRDLYDRQQPAAPQVPDGRVTVRREDAEALSRFVLGDANHGVRNFQLWASAQRVQHCLATPPAPEQPKPECPCGEATCEEPWEPGCGLGRSEEHVRVAEQPKPAGDVEAMAASVIEEMLHLPWQEVEPVAREIARRLAAQPAQGEVSE